MEYSAQLHRQAFLIKITWSTVKLIIRWYGEEDHNTWLIYQWVRHSLQTLQIVQALFNLKIIQIKINQNLKIHSKIKNQNLISPNIWETIEIIYKINNLKNIKACMNRK